MYFYADSKALLVSNSQIRDRLVLLDNVRCNGDEGSLKNCSHVIIGVFSCLLGHATSAVCSNGKL